jgi:hypothetical protein
MKNNMIFKKVSVLVIAVMCSVGCSQSPEVGTGKLEKDTLKPEVIVEKEFKDSLNDHAKEMLTLNDTLNALANIMSGISDSNVIYKNIQSSSDFKAFSKNFDKRW